MNIRLWAFLLLTTPQLLLGEPWGKDADLAYFKPRENCLSPCNDVNPAVKLSSIFIRFHKRVISPADGPRSNFLPNSSQYALDAINKYGFIKGYIMGCDRLMRENSDPWIYRKTRGKYGPIKYDPVK